MINSGNKSKCEIKTEIKNLLKEPCHFSLILQVLNPFISCFTGLFPNVPHCTCYAVTSWATKKVLHQKVHTCGAGYVTKCISLQIMTNTNKSVLKSGRTELCQNKSLLIDNSTVCARNHNLKRKHCWCFTGSSFHFSWKLQLILCIGMFWEFCKNVGIGTYFQRY